MLTFSTMCTIAILVGVAEAPVVLAANRDELYARASEPPQQLAAGVAGGRDAQSGGTWLAIHRAGRFAAVTNQHAMEQPAKGLRSRGLAVLELAAAADPDAYVAALDPRAYASMNLVWGDAARVNVGYLRHDGAKTIITLPTGVHVLCNDRIGAPGFPRGERLQRAIEAALERDRSWRGLAPAVQRALSDHTRLSLEDTPRSHLLPELARELTATCIHGEIYGTRSSSLVALVPGRVLAYDHADGPPCVTRFESKLELLA